MFLISRSMRLRLVPGARIHGPGAIVSKPGLFPHLALGHLIFSEIGFEDFGVLLYFFRNALCNGTSEVEDQDAV